MKFIVSAHHHPLQVAEALVHCLDDENAKDFCDQLHEAVKNVPCLVLDMSKVFFIDVAALTHLLDLRSRFQVRGIELELCRLHDNVVGLFEITQLGKSFRLHTTVAEAIQSFEARHPALAQSGAGKSLASALG